MAINTFISVNNRKITYAYAIVYVFLIITFITLLIIIIGQYKYESFKSTPNIKTLYVQRVTTPSSIAGGLMYRQTPLNNSQGLLFDKGSWSTSGFWMKNTYIPLDILFFDEEFKIIDILYNMKPHDTTVYNINKPWRYAIEINADSIHDIKPGQYINVIDIGKLD